MATKTNKKQPVKKKLSKASVKPSVLKKTSVKSKTTSAKTKTVKKPVKSVTKKLAPAKKLSKQVKKPVKLVKKPVAKVKTVAKAAVPAIEKVAKVKAAPKSRKKATKIDKKLARTLIKIANSQKTAVATVGVQSAAMAAVRATMVMAAANANNPQSQTAQAANHSYSNSNQNKLGVNPAATKPADAVKPVFKTGDVVVYPAHGVGKVDGVEAHTIGGTEVKLFRITFDHERMTLKVPVQRATGSGLRQLSSKETMKSVFETMKGRPRVRRVMWSRRAQEYEQKINSGDPVAIAEVLRDLRRNAESGDQSYSERQIFQNALERLSREVAAIEKIDQEKATQKLSDLLLRKLPAAANADDAEDAA